MTATLPPDPLPIAGEEDTKAGYRERFAHPPHNSGCIWILVLILFLWFAIHQAMTGDFA